MSIINMKTLDKAISWYADREIKAFYDDDEIYIQVNGFDLYLSRNEITYRAGIYDQEKNEARTEVKELKLKIKELEKRLDMVRVWSNDTNDLEDLL